MLKKVIAALVIALMAGPAQAQTAPKQDSVCVPVKQLQAMRQEVETLRRRDSLNTEIKRNLRVQVLKLETVSEQDSVVIGTLERELSYRKDQIELRDQRINNLQSQLQKQEVRKWVYFAGGAATVVLGAWVSGQAAN